MTWLFRNKQWQLPSSPSDYKTNNIPTSARTLTLSVLSHPQISHPTEILLRVLYQTQNLKIPVKNLNRANNKGVEGLQNLAHDLEKSLKQNEVADDSQWLRKIASIVAVFLHVFIQTTSEQTHSTDTGTLFSTCEYKRGWDCPATWGSTLIRSSCGKESWPH